MRNEPRPIQNSENKTKLDAGTLWERKQALWKEVQGSMDKIGETSRLCGEAMYASEDMSRPEGERSRLKEIGEEFRKKSDFWLEKNRALSVEYDKLEHPERYKEEDDAIARLESALGKYNE